ncbi:20601_t:CDS:1, partial [Funneliformis geosporum]
MTEKILLDQYFVSAGLEALDSYVYNATVSKWIDHNIEQRSFVKGNTEDYYHIGIDTCIKYTIETLTDGITISRNTCYNTSIGHKRPDTAGCILNNAIWRGEEKGTDSAGDSSQELTEKIIWDYGDAVPYLLAYYSIE